MFTLRKINGKGMEMNFFLGDEYNIIYKERHPEEFEAFVKTVGLDPDTARQCYGYVTHADGSKHQCLYKKQQNYIMTTDGKTFANVTLKQTSDQLNSGAVTPVESEEEINTMQKSNWSTFSETEYATQKLGFHHTEKEVDRPYSVFFESIHDGEIIAAGYGNSWEEALIDLDRELAKPRPQIRL